MSTLFLTHADCLNHITPTGHPEQVARLQAINAALGHSHFDGLIRQDAPLAEDPHILRAHPQHHLDRIVAAAPDDGAVSLDADTHMSPGSLTAARRAAGGNVRAVDAVMAGTAHNAFVACRPPGHHAETETPMGFCLFGNVVIAAKHALDHHGLSRVAIIDFDVHHGNGTQDLVWDDARIRFASTHQWPLYPGTGAPSERGGHDNVLNVTLDPGTDGAAFRAAMDGQVLPFLDDFAPELVLISAGFDAHRADPLANLNWDEEDFAWATARLCDLAETYARGRVVSTLEGGYDLNALAAGVAAHVGVLMERGDG